MSFTPRDDYRRERTSYRAQSQPKSSNSWSYDIADRILESISRGLTLTFKGVKKITGSSREKIIAVRSRKAPTADHQSHTQDDALHVGDYTVSHDFAPARSAMGGAPRPPKKKNKKLPSIIKKVGGILLISMIIGPIVVCAGLYAFVIAPLPPIETIESKSLTESSVIYDKDGGELYRFGAENRSYVTVDQISQPIKDAIVSIEDKTFYENPGVDLYGLARVVLSRVFGLTDRITGASTISQQLIKNMLLNNERSLTRKVKEAWLAYALNQKYSKDKILELYLNKISFGHNAYGIEEASKTFFGKSAKDVGVFGASVLASLPKGPTLYSPLSNRDRVIGYPFVYPANSSSEVDFPEGVINNPEQMKAFASDLSILKQFLQKIEIKNETESSVELCGIKQSQFIDSSVVNVGGDGCANISRADFFDFLTKIRLDAAYKGGGLNPEGAYYIEYYVGRKDAVLSRMYEDDKISFEEARDAVVAGMEYHFVRRAENIKAPHFVFYVKEYLESQFGKELDLNQGVKIYTTLDPKFQAKAEMLVRDQVAKNKSRQASSAALVSIDNSNGGVLAMVGSHDYWDSEGNGQVNVTTSQRQPGSSFKPFSYAYAMSQFPVSPDTPIYDVRTEFGNWKPDNYDGKFMGRMSLRTALDYSRNIPATKVFLYAGGNPAITKFVRSIGIDSISENNTHGSALSLGSAEVKPIEMAQAYSVFANGGWYKDINPIVRLEDSDGKLIYSSAEDSAKKPILAFSEGASYLISNTLSDTKSRPAGWNTYLTLRGRPVAVKTGTSNKEITKTKILPRDLWTVGYTPQITTAVWAGNLNGKETAGTCDGLNCAAPIWRDYMNYAHESLPVKQFERPKEGLYEVAISKVSGKLATSATPKSLVINALFAVKPQQSDSGNKIVDYDTLCNGPATDATPADSRRQGMILAVEPIIESSQAAWKKGLAMNWESVDGVDTAVDILTNYREEPCERPGEGSQKITMSADLPSGAIGFGRYPIKVSYDVEGFARKVVLYFDNQVIASQDIAGNQVKGSVTLTPSFDISSAGSHTLRVSVFDRYGYSSSTSSDITVSRNGREAPIPGGSTGSTQSGSDTSISLPTGSDGIVITSPRSGALTIRSTQSATIAFQVNGTAADTVEVFVDGGEDRRTFTADRSSYQVSFSGLSPGQHIITITAGSLRKDMVVLVE